MNEPFDDRSWIWHEAWRAKHAAHTAVALDLKYLLSLRGFEIVADDQDCADAVVRRLREQLAVASAAHGVMVDETAGARIDRG